MAGYAGDFSLAAAVGGHPAGTMAHVTVSAAYPSRLVLEFSDEGQGQTDARVLLCGHIGAHALLGLGYTGPLATRPRLAPTRTRPRGAA